MGNIRRSFHTKTKVWDGDHRFEHWYVDNQVYFITSKCRNGFPAFQTPAAKQIFWDRFDHYTALHGFDPFVTTAMNNHYHTLGYLERGIELAEMMRKLHGSIAKLVNDTLSERHRPFWRGRGGRDYFDGCIRDEKQFVRAYRYTLLQSERHGVCRDWREYPNTRVSVQMDEALRLSVERKAFLYGVPYPRYSRDRDR